MSETEQNRTQSDQTEGVSPESALPDETLDALEDVVVEEVAFVADPAAEVVEDAEIIDSDPAEEAAAVDDLAAADDAPAPSPSPVPAPEPAPAGAGTGSMIIGGVLAAAIGAAAVLVFLPEGWRTVDTSSLERRLTALEDAGGGSGLEALDTRVATLEDIGAPDLTPLSDRITALEGIDAADLAPLTARIETLETTALGAPALSAAIAPLNTRIAQIEADIVAQARAAVEAALAEARAEVEAQAASLSSREGDVEAAQARIAARAALAELVAAAESGTPQPGAVATLTQGEVPEALLPFNEGLITLAALQEGFATSARAALNADAPAADAPISDRLMNFLRSQTGARSLAPREGDDADAVLSRAEALLRQGDLVGTLTELDALSGAPAEALADWRAQAEVRLAAVAAVNTLQDQLTGNEG